MLSEEEKRERRLRAKKRKQKKTEMAVGLPSGDGRMLVNGSYKLEEVDDSIDLNLPTGMNIKDGIADLGRMPKTASIILGLRSLGYGYTRISKMLELSVTTIVGYCKRYDPDGLCKLTSSDKRLITSEMLTSTALNSLIMITHEKLEATSAKDLATIAQRCSVAAETLRLGGKIKETASSSRIDSMMNMLEAEVEEVS